MSTRAQVRSDEWLAPEEGDADGRVPTARLLEWLEGAGAVAAARHCRRAVVGEAIDLLTIDEPVRAGETISVSAQVAHTHGHSVAVRVLCERPRVEAWMRFQPLDRRGRPVVVPRYWPQSPADQARFREGQARRELRQRLDVLFERLPRRIKRPWENPSPRLLERGAYLHRIEIVRPSVLGAQDAVMGGTLLGWCEALARRSARLQAGTAVRASAMHDVSLSAPIERDRFVHLHALVVRDSGSELTCLVGVEAEDPAEGTLVECLRGFFTFTPQNALARLPTVPPISADEHALAEEVEQRRALARSLGQALPTPRAA
jgi:acyl-CoA hydrolase